MAWKSLKWIYKMILVIAFLFLIKIFKEWSFLGNRVVVFEPRNVRNEFKSIENRKKSEMVDRRTEVLDYEAFDQDRTSKLGLVLPTKKSRPVESVYGSDCPPNPYKATLKHLFKHWMTLDNYYNLSSFICSGSLLGSMRDGDLIPYDRDIDVCVTFKNYQKVRDLRSQKPFRPLSSRIHVAIQEDISINDASKRIRVNCKGRVVRDGRDACSFDKPGARLISRGVYVDVFVLHEQGGNLRDYEYDKELLNTDIFPLKDCMFMGVDTKCPRNEMSYLLKYFKPDVLIKPHYKCRNKTWVATSRSAKKQFSIWFDKRVIRRLKAKH
jgi:uncharacterized ubiquitin-like protein YukD